MNHIELVAQTGARTHFGQLSCARSVDMLRAAKVKGLPIWRKWYVVLHKGKRLSVAAEEFRTLLINEAVGLLQD